MSIAQPTDAEAQAQSQAAAQAYERSISGDINRFDDRRGSRMRDGDGDSRQASPDRYRTRSRYFD